MEPADRLRIQRNLTSICSDLEPSDVFPQLIQHEVLSFKDKERIMHQETREERAMKLVELLLQKGDKAYQALVSALTDSYSHLADLLQNTSISDNPHLALGQPDARPDIVSVTSTELEEFYERALTSLSPLPWCAWFQLNFKNLFTQIQLVEGCRKKCVTRTMSKDSRDSLNDNGNGRLVIEDIFHSYIGCKLPNRILIEGGPGMGKSTLCQKVTLDWIDCVKNGRHNESENYYVHSYVHKFKLLFLLKARNINDSIYDCIFENLLPEDFAIAKSEMKAYIENHQQEVMFIIDGFDEMADTSNAALIKLIQRRILPRCTVVITSRPHFASNLVRDFDSTYILKGYSTSKIFDFIEKYAADLKLPSCMFDSLKHEVEKHVSIKDLCRNPLNLCLLCILCEEKDGNFPVKRAEIFEKVTNLLVKKAKIRHECTEEQITMCLNELFKLAFVCLQHNTNMFKSEDCAVPETCLNLGFVTKELPLSRFEDQTHFVFSHKSFQEYFGARYVGSLPSKQRIEILKKYLKNKSFVTMWIFYSGIVCDSEEILEELVKELQTQTIAQPIENLKQYLVRIPTYVDFKNIGIQDLWVGTAALFFRCIKEFSFENLSNKLVTEIIKCVPEQINFSHPFGSSSAVSSCVKLAKLFKHIIAKRKVVLAGQLFDEDKYQDFLDSLRELQKSSIVNSLGLHLVTDVSELVQAISVFQIDSPFTTIETLQVRFSDVVYGDQDEMPDVKIGPRLHTLELYSCGKAVLLEQILNEISKNCKSLTKLVINSSFVDLDLAATFQTCLDSLNSITNFTFTDNIIKREIRSQVCNKVLQGLSNKKASLKWLAVSGVTKRVVHAQDLVDQAFDAENINLVKQICNSNQLEHVHISKSILTKELIEVLISLKKTGHLVSLELEYNLISCVDVFNTFLETLKYFPKLTYLSVKGSTIRSIEDINFSAEALAQTRLKSNCLSPIMDDVRVARHRSKSTSEGMRGLSPLRKRIMGIPLIRLNSLPDGMHDKVAIAAIQHTNMDDRKVSINLLGQYVVNSNSLTSLVLSDLQPTDLHCLCQSLAKNNSLVAISLISCCLNECSLTSLAHFLECHKTLECLNLAKTNICSATVDTFLKAVAKCRSLQVLDLTHCNLHNDYMLNLGQCLLENPSIRHVLLRGNGRITVQGITELYQKLRDRRQRLGTLDLSDCKITKADAILVDMKEVVFKVKVNWF